MMICLSLERRGVKREVLFETTPDDHAAMHNFFLAVTDLRMDKEEFRISPLWKEFKYQIAKTAFYNRLVPRVPAGWTLTDYRSVDYP
jgi:hypothetical protein